MDVAFHIGYHKTASSWLQREYFPAHPQIATICDSKSPRKDPFLSYLIATPEGKFDSGKCNTLLRDRIAASKKNGDKIVNLVSAERLSGYPLSGGFDSFRMAQRIHSVAPEAKIFIVIREQTEIINSVYKQMVREGYPGSLDNMLNTNSWKTTGFGLNYFEYDLLVSKYLSLFGRQNVLVLPYELMRQNKTDFAQLLCRFFCVAQMAPSTEEKLVNQSIPDSNLGIIRVLNHFRSSELNPCPPFVIPDWLRNNLIKTIAPVVRTFNSRTPIMSETQKSWLADYYKPSNQRVNKLAGTDLPALAAEIADTLKKPN